jgi:hypothetical protein
MGEVLYLEVVLGGASVVAPVRRAADFFVLAGVLTAADGLEGEAR